MGHVPVAFFPSLQRVSPRTLSAVHERLRKVCRPLYVASLPELLLNGASPGTSTLFCPQQTDRERQARDLSWGVIATTPRDARNFAKQGRPTFLIEEESCKDLETWVERLRKPVRKSPTAKGELLEFCSVIDANYFPHWYGLFQNLRAVHNGPLKAHVLVLDEKANGLVRTHIAARDARRYTLEEVFTPSELVKVKSRSIALQAFSSKPAILAHAMRRAQGPVFLMDSDLYFFKSPSNLVSSLKEKSLLLFPQWNDDIRYARLHGLFNTGLVLARKEALAFIDWWRELCLWECRYDTAKGFFIDQGYIDLAPLYFEDVAIYRNGDHNVGNWNLDSLGVSVTGGKPTLSGGIPLASYHAAIPDSLGLFDFKATWDQIHSFDLNLSTPSLEQQALRQQSRLWPDLQLLEMAQRTLADRLHLPVPQPSAAFARLWTDPRFTLPRNVLVQGYRGARQLKDRLFPRELDA